MVVLILIISIIYSLPNLYSSYPALEVNKNSKIDIQQVINIIDPNIKVENVIQENNKFIFKVYITNVSFFQNYFKRTQINSVIELQTGFGRNISVICQNRQNIA